MSYRNEINLHDSSVRASYMASQKSKVVRSGKTNPVRLGTGNPYQNHFVIAETNNADHQAYRP